MRSVMTQRKHAASVGHGETEDDLVSVRKHMTFPEARYQIPHHSLSDKNHLNLEIR